MSWKNSPDIDWLIVIAAVIVYNWQVHKFLDKNYDQVRQDILDLFIQSKNKVREEKHMIASYICHLSSVFLLK